MPFLKRHWPWIVLLLIPLIPLWKAVFMGQAIGPFDHIRQFAPWNGPRPGQPWDVLQADGVLQFYVWRDLVFESWGKGQIPFWNPYELAGTPLLANSQSGALYPPHILMGVLHVPTALAITLLAWFHLFWAGFGIHRLVRTLGGSRTGGVLAGASFILSPFMLGWTGLSSVITTVCWIPWMLWGVASLFYLPPGIKAGIDEGRVNPIRRHQWRMTWLIALFFAMTILGGHLQFVAYGGIAVVVFAVGLWFVRLRELKEMKLSEDSKEESFVAWQERSNFAETPVAIKARLAAALIFGLLLAAPQLLPVLQHSQTSHRKNVPTEAGYEAYANSAIQPFEAVGLVTPKLVGDPNDYIPNIEAGPDGPSSYWPQIFKRGANFAEGALGIGPVVLLLLFCLRKKHRVALPVAAVGLIGILLAFGTVLGKALYFWLPGWSSTGSPGRAIVLFVLAACVLAGLVLPDEREEEAPSKARLYGPIAGLALVGILALWQAKVGLVDLKSLYPGIDGSIIGLALANYIVPAFLVLVVAAGFGYAWLSGKVTKAWVWIPVAVAIAAYQTAGLVPSGKPLDRIQGPTDPFARIAIVNDSWEIVVPPKAILPPNLAAYNRIHELAGYDSLLQKDTKKMLDEVNGQDSAPPANGNMMFVKFTFDAKKLAEAGVTEVWSTRPLPQPELKLISNEGILKYSLEGPGRVSVDGKPGQIVEETGSSIAVEVEGPGHLVLRERNIGTWVGLGSGGGKPERNRTWVELDIPEGRHRITFTRLNVEYATGLMLAGLGLLIMGSAILIVKAVTRSKPEKVMV